MRMRVLDNPIRPYAWGSTTAIPRLLGVPPTGDPQAELWMGAHPGSPSQVGERSLLDLIAADPAVLGTEVAGAFEGRLPFLLKLLAAAEPLSLQAHPDPRQARAGFERENAAGVPLSSPERSYQDAYAKPELICALTPFEALVGFRPVAEVLADADKLDVPELASYLHPLRQEPSAEGLRHTFTALMSASEEGRGTAVEATVAAARASDLTVADLLVRLGERHPGDPGVVAALLLNHVFLEPGEALFLPAGNLHAYIRGFGVEVLANSDNVLRGGLTRKHVDVPELLSILDFTPRAADILRPVGETEATYVTPAREFRLSRIGLREGDPVTLEPAGPQILLCTSGQVEATSVGSSGSGRAATGPAEPILLTAGRSAFAGSDEGSVTIAGEGTLFRVTANLA